MMVLLLQKVHEVALASSRRDIEIPRTWPCAGPQHMPMCSTNEGNQP